MNSVAADVAYALLAFLRKDGFKRAVTSAPHSSNGYQAAIDSDPVPRLAGQGNAKSVIVTCSTPAEIRALVAQWRAEGQRIALVPTMGALHAGHGALVEAAKQVADRVIASIFVNPTQFAPHEDFSSYPRTLAADLEMLSALDCEAVYIPEARAVYPPGDSTRVHVEGLSQRWEGVHRPHFFGGVTTVVSRLLIHINPDVALFGEKDWQQLQVVKRMVLDLGLPVEVQGVATVRGTDGLALSSRNAYLTKQERVTAATLNRAMTAMAQLLLEGSSIAQAATDFKKTVLAAGFRSVDYIAVVDPKTLEPLEEVSVETPARLLAAAWLGETRLIDNGSITELAEL